MKKKIFLAAISFLFLYVFISVQAEDETPFLDDNTTPLNDEELMHAQAVCGEWGWVDTDKYPKKRTNGFLMTKTEDNSINGDLFKGLKMKASAKRKVEFIPPQPFAKSGYDDAVKDLLKQLSGLVTDYEKNFGKK